MSGEIVVELPPLAYAQLQAMAAAQQRAVAAIASDLILAELPAMPALSEDVEQELAAFDQLSDDVLVLLANSTLSAQEQTELAELNEQAQSRGLLSAEAERREHLLARYDRTLVRRAQAALVLRRRGQTQSPHSIFPDITEDRKWLRRAKSSLEFWNDAEEDTYRAS